VTLPGTGDPAAVVRLNRSVASSIGSDSTAVRRAVGGTLVSPSTGLLEDTLGGVVSGWVPGWNTASTQ